MNEKKGDYSLLNYFNHQQPESRGLPPTQHNNGRLTQYDQTYALNNQMYQACAHHCMRKYSKRNGEYCP